MKLLQVHESIDMGLFLSAFITHYTISQTMPHLIRLFRDPSEITNRPATLTALEVILRAVRDAYTPQNEFSKNRSYEVEKPLDPFKDDVLGVLTVGLKNPGSDSPALMGLDAMVNVSGLLTNEELGFVVHNINELLSAGDDTGNDTR